MLRLHSSAPFARGRPDRRRLTTHTIDAPVAIGAELGVARIAYACLRRRREPEQLTAPSATLIEFPGAGDPTQAEIDAAAQAWLDGEGYEAACQRAEG
jgi:hypothetical protein